MPSPAIGISIWKNALGDTNNVINSAAITIPAVTSKNCLGYKYNKTISPNTIRPAIILMTFADI